MYGNRVRQNLFISFLIYYQHMSQSMFPLLLCMLIGASVCQYDTSWTIALSRAPTALRIVSSGRSNHQLILAGHTTGQLEIIDAHTKQLLKSLHVLDERVKQIEVDEKGVCFVVGSINMVELDHQYNIRRVFNYEHNITHLSLSHFDQTNSFANFLVGSRIITLQSNAESFNCSGVAFSEEIAVEHSMVQMSPNHEYLYTVDKQRQSFTIQKVVPSIDMKTNQIYFQSKHFLQRRFSFKIAHLLLDRKQNHKVDDQLLMVADDGTIFYIRAGNIVTYIPYTIASNQHFVAAEFCDNGFIVIVHERRINSEYSNFFLTLIRKDSLTSHKVIILDEIFGEILDIERIDCNHNLIVLLSKAKRLYVLEGFRVFSIQDYLQHILIVLGVVFIILYLYNKVSKKTPQKKTSQSDSSRKQTPQKTNNKNPQIKNSTGGKKKRKGD